jgi:hypothetical protein
MSIDDTSGPLFTASSPSAGLQYCLESRLRRRLGANGSPLCALIWSTWDMRSGPPICRLRASVRRTSGNGSGLLPTLAAQSYGSNQGGGMGRVGPVRHSLETMARQHLWPTPTSTLGTKAGLATPKKAREGGTLVEMVAARMWPTPTMGDAKSSGSRNTPGSKAHAGISLTDAVRRDGGTGRMWPTPRSNEGTGGAKPPPNREGGPALKTAVQLPNMAGGPLNPAWVGALMGYPPEWSDAAPQKTPCRRLGRTAVGKTASPGLPRA